MPLFNLVDNWIFKIDTFGLWQQLKLSQFPLISFKRVWTRLENVHLRYVVSFPGIGMIIIPQALISPQKINGMPFTALREKKTNVILNYLLIWADKRNLEIVFWKFEML